MFFLLCCRLNFSLNKLYPDKTNKNKDYNFFITFFFSLRHFIPCLPQNDIDIFLSINSRLLCRLDFYLLAYLSFFHQKCEQTVNISRERVCA